MRRYAARMSEGGQVTVPLPLRESLRLKPGATLIFQQEDAGTVRLMAEPPPAPEPDALLRLPEIAAAARRSIGPVESSTDPIGDWLVGEDERTKSGP